MHFDISLHAGQFFMFFVICCFFHNKLFKKKYFRNTISVKQFGSRSGPTFCWSWSGSKMVVKFISRQVNASKERVKSGKATTCPGSVIWNTIDDKSGSWQVKSYSLCLILFNSLIYQIILEHSCKILYVIHIYIG